MRLKELARRAEAGIEVSDYAQLVAGSVGHFASGAFFLFCV